MSFFESFTKLHIGEDFDNIKMGKFSLIMTRNPNDQSFHLDILGGDKNHQYVMLLTGKSKTTKICRPKGKEMITTKKN